MGIHSEIDEELEKYEQHGMYDHSSIGRFGNQPSDARLLSTILARGCTGTGDQYGYFVACSAVQDPKTKCGHCFLVDIGWKP